MIPLKSQQFIMFGTNSASFSKGSDLEVQILILITTIRGNQKQKMKDSPQQKFQILKIVVFGLSRGGVIILSLRKVYYK